MKNNDRNKKIASIVELIMKEKNHNPRDSVFRFNEEYYPEEQHISLRFPGKFVKTVSTEVFTVNNRNFKMDSAHHVLPDEKLPYESLINPEHQHKQLTLEKKDALYDYKLQLIFKHKKPALNVVVSNIGTEDHEEIYESHGDAFKTYHIVITDEEVTKRLNNLTEKVKKQEKLSVIESLDFGYILLFVNANMAKEYTRKVTILFKEIKNMDPELKRDLHFQMKKLIRLHFIDDEVETRRLLTMITEAIQTDKLDELTTFQKAMQKIEKQTEELYEKNKEIKHKNKTIENKDKEIKHKNKTIENKDEEIEKLKEILNSHNIKY